MNIRSMLLTDTPAVNRIEQNCYEFAWTEGIFRDCLTVGYPSWVLELNGVVIGYAILGHVLEDAHLLNICIDKPYHHQGYGKQLLSYIMQYLQAQGCQNLFLEVRKSNLAAIDFYTKTGFQITGIRKNYYQAVSGREDAVLMTYIFQ